MRSGLGLVDEYCRPFVRHLPVVLPPVFPTMVLLCQPSLPPTTKPPEVQCQVPYDISKLFDVMATSLGSQYKWMAVFPHARQKPSPKQHIYEKLELKT